MKATGLATVEMETKRTNETMIMDCLDQEWKQGSFAKKERIPAPKAEKEEIGSWLRGVDGKERGTM